MTAKDLTLLSDDEIIRTALSENKSFNQAAYMDELARRALDRPELIEVACEAVENGRQMLPRHPAPGWAAGARLLDSGNRKVIERLLASMDRWSSTEQNDMIDFWAGNKKREAARLHLKQVYGWAPKETPKT